MSNYSDEIRGQGPSGNNQKPLSPLARQLNRALDAASDPFFENDHVKRTPMEQYNATWKEVTHPDLMPREIDLLRVSIGTHWIDVHPERVQRCDDGPYRRAMLLDPRKAGKPAVFKVTCDADMRKLLDEMKASNAEFETAAIAAEIASMGAKKAVARPDDSETPF